MDARGYGSNYSSWGSGGSGNRGSGGFESYGGGYKDSMSGSGGFGGGSHMKRGISGGSPLSSGGTHADAVIAKINHRLDMLSQFEGGFKGPRGDGFDQYESFDSRSSALPSRDLYRSGGSSFGFGDVRGDGMLLNQQGGSSFGGGMGLGGAGGGFDSPSSGYGVAKMRPNMRESFASGQGGGSGGGGWVGAHRRSPRRGGSAGGRGGFGGRRSDPTPLGGGLRGSGSGVQSHGGYSPGGGRGKLPSLLSNRMYPESGGFQGSAAGPHDFPGRHFGGGPRAGRQRGRKRPLNKQVKPQGDFQKKRKTPAEGDEPESKMNRKEDEGTETTQAEEPERADDKGETETDGTLPAEGGDATAHKQEEMAKPHGKQGQAQIQEKQPKSRKRRGFLERVMFACSVCKFRSFYKADMEVHLESRFHKEHFKFLSSQLSKPTTDFLQEYLKNKFKKTDERVSQMENHSAAICQMYREQDLTRELGMEHFMRKVEAAHCSACDVFIPMQPHLIQKHMKSHDHNYNRKGMMEQSKRGCLSVARSILNHKLIGKKLESYLKGENPFVGNQDEQDPEDAMANEAAEVTGEAAAGQEEAKDEAAPEAATVKEEMEEVEVGPATAAIKEEDEEGNMEQDGDQENAEMEGFEVGEDEDEGYIVHNEFEEEGFQDAGEEDEGANVA